MGKDGWAMELCPLGSDILMHQPTLSTQKSLVSLTEKDGGKLIMNALGHNMNYESHTFRDLCPQRDNYFTVPFLLFGNIVAVACHLCSLNVHLLSCKICQES